MPNDIVYHIGMLLIKPLSLKVSTLIEQVSNNIKNSSNLNALPNNQYNTPQTLIAKLEGPKLTIEEPQSHSQNSRKRLWGKSEIYKIFGTTKPK